MQRGIIILTGMLLLLGCTDKQLKKEQDFLAAVDSFYAAVNSGNQQAHADLFTENAFMLSDDWTISRGAELKKSIAERRGWVFRLKDLQRLEHHVSGDVGYTINEYYYTWHREGQEADWKKTKNVHIWRLQTDGYWKLHMDIWNHSPELEQG